MVILYNAPRVLYDLLNSINGTILKGDSVSLGDKLYIKNILFNN